MDDLDYKGWRERSADLARNGIDIKYTVKKADKHPCDGCRCNCDECYIAEIMWMEQHGGNSHA